MTEDTRPKSLNQSSWVATMGVVLIVGVLYFVLSPQIRRNTAAHRSPTAVEAPSSETASVAVTTAAEAEPAPIPVKDPHQIQIEASVALIDKADSSYARLSGYEAVFDTRELNDRGEWVSESSFLRFNKPFTLFMGWTSGDKKGLQIMYSKDNFDDKMIVRPAGMLFGLIPPVSVELDDPRILKQSKHPITRAGIGYFLSDFGDSFRKLQGQGRIKVLSVGESVDVGGENGTLLDVVFQDPSEDYARRAVVFSDKSNLPIEIRLYKTENNLVESYRYASLQVDPSSDDPEFKKVADPRMVEKFKSTKPT